MKIGYVLSAVYFVFLVAFGISLTIAPVGESTMIFRFFYVIAGIFDLIDILTPKVRKSFF